MKYPILTDVDDKMTLQITDSLGRLQETYIINESGFYSLVRLRDKYIFQRNFKKSQEWVGSKAKENGEV